MHNSSYPKMFKKVVCILASLSLNIMTLLPRNHLAIDIDRNLSRSVSRCLSIPLVEPKQQCENKSTNRSRSSKIKIIMSMIFIDNDNNGLLYIIRCREIPTRQCLTTYVTKCEEKATQEVILTLSMLTTSSASTTSSTSSQGDLQIAISSASSASGTGSKIYTNQLTEFSVQYPQHSASPL